MKNSFLFVTLSLFIFFQMGIVVAQPLENKQHTSFIEGELRTGTIVPNFPTSPKSGLQKTLSLRFGRAIHNEKHWVQYYNYPSYGVNLSYSESDNISTYGRELGLSGFLELSPDRGEVRNWFFNLGLGASYFSRYYNSETNSDNLAIGSAWNWRFQAFLYRPLKRTESYSLRLGAGYVHSSNGHVQLPNYGLNAAMIGLSARIFKGANPMVQGVYPKGKEKMKKASKTAFFQIRNGLGFHALGGTTEPIGGAAKAIFATSIGGGVTLNRQLRVRSGFTYRYYQHFYDYIVRNQLEEYRESPHSSASNVLFLLGVEYLVGQFAIDIEGGINLYKPFYSYFYEEFETSRGIKEFMKKTFTTRMGLNYYFVKWEKQKAFNVYIGASINANFGQADFTQLNIGVCKKISTSK